MLYINTPNTQTMSFNSKIIRYGKESLDLTLKTSGKEIRMIFSDLGVMIIVLAVPLLYPLLYSLIYYPEVVREMPIGVVDQSASSQSRDFIRDLEATPELTVAYHCLSMDEARELFMERKIRGILSIPSNFARDIALSRQTTVSAYADMEYFLYYKALLTGTNFVALETGENIQVQSLKNTGLSSEQAMIVAQPIELVDNAIANPSGGFASYGVPASLILIIQQTLILAMGIMSGTVREKRSRELYLDEEMLSSRVMGQILGKTIAYLAIYSVLCVYMLGLIPDWFGYAHLAGFKELSALIIPFLLASIFMGLTLSGLFQKRESSMMLYLFTSIPLLFLSGVIWPLSNFNAFWLTLREFFPSSDAIFGFIKMNSLGASITETRKEIVTLWIQASAYLLTAATVLWYRQKVGRNTATFKSPDHRQSADPLFVVVP
jgi:ABC-2 type transport system permease protein